MSSVTENEKTPATAVAPVSATSLRTGAAAAAASVSRIASHTFEEEPDAPAIAPPESDSDDERTEHHPHLLTEYHRSPYADAKTIYCDHRGCHIDASDVSLFSNPVYHCNVCGEYDECNKCYNRAEQTAQFELYLSDISRHMKRLAIVQLKAKELVTHYTAEFEKLPQRQPYDIGCVVPYDTTLKGVDPSIVFPRTVVMRVEGVEQTCPVLVLASRPNHPLTQPEASQRKLSLYRYSAFLRLKATHAEITGWLSPAEDSLYLQFLILMKLAIENGGSLSDPLLSRSLRAPVIEKACKLRCDSLTPSPDIVIARNAAAACAAVTGKDGKQTVTQLREKLKATQEKLCKDPSLPRKKYETRDNKADDEIRLIDSYFKYLPQNMAPAIPSDAHPVTVLDPAFVPIAVASAPSAAAAAADTPAVENGDSDASDDATVEPEKADEDGPDGEDEDDDSEGDSETEASAATAALDELPEYKRKAIADNNLSAGNSAYFKDTISKLELDYAVDDKEWMDVNSTMQFRPWDELISEAKEERRQYDLKRKAVAEYGFDTTAMSASATAAASDPEEKPRALKRIRPTPVVTTTAAAAASAPAIEEA